MPIVINDLIFTYNKGEPDESHALKGVSLKVNDGDAVLIAGRNGSGKSTLLNCISGLMAPLSGSIKIDGKDPRNIKGPVSLAVQFPERALFERTLYDDIAFGPRNLKLGKKEVHERVLRSLRSAGLGESLLYRNPRELSHGQKRLAAIAGVISTGPKYLLLDEPTAGLDYKGREQVLRSLKDLNASGMSIMIASHALGHMLGLCKRVVIIDKGMIISDSTAEKFTDEILSENSGFIIPETVLLARKLKERGLSTSGTMSVEELASCISSHTGGRMP